MTNYDFESDPDFSQAEAPQGFQFGIEGTTLNVLEAEEFLPEVNEAIDGLLWLGYLTEEVEVYNHRFTIKTLTRGERLIIAQLTKEYEDTLGMADAYEAAQIAASLVAIDGLPLADIEPGTDQSVRIRANFGRVKNWYEPVLTQLSVRIAALGVRQQQAFLTFQSK